MWTTGSISDKITINIILFKVTHYWSIDYKIIYKEISFVSVI